MKTPFIKILMLAIVFAAAVAALASTATYNYDDAGRIVSADFGSKSISYVYDNSGNLLHSSQPTPSVFITPLFGDQFTLAWPVSPAGFHLQSAPSLSSGVMWMDVPNLVVPVGAFNYVIVTNTSTQFYRLAKP